MKRKAILLILDGWGINEESKYNAVDNASKPVFDKLVRKYPNIQLKSHGEYVGLPEDQFGTSEINHGVIGSGRVSRQLLPRINHEIESGKFNLNTEILNSIRHAKMYSKKIHIAGIFSDGNVHSSIEHLIALISLVQKHWSQNIYLHLFTDGRDVAPKSAEKYFKRLDKYLIDSNIKIASIQGRFFLDRDRDWERTAQAVKLLMKGEGVDVLDWQSAINFSYAQNESDEFFRQYILDQRGIVEDGDVFINFNFRSDRMYQLLKRLEAELPELLTISFANVSEELRTKILFDEKKTVNTLSEVLSKNNIRQLHITETEKYPHLTFFFNGENESAFSNEDWELIPSNRYVKPYYNFEPTMQTFKMAKRISEEIEKGVYDFIVANFAAPDMVGHTGNYEAAKVAIEAIDFALGKIYESLEDKLDEYVLIITADHGNADKMWDSKNNQPHTQHTTAPVPFIVVSNTIKDLKQKESLEDIAPTILDIFKIEKPAEMTGESLIVN